jgi:hypothetical protein
MMLSPPPTTILLESRVNSISNSCRLSRLSELECVNIDHHSNEASAMEIEFNDAKGRNRNFCWIIYDDIMGRSKTHSKAKV